MKEVLVGKNRNGQSVLELMIALAIAVITISSIAIVSLGNRSILVDTQENAEAIRIAGENLEIIRKNSFTDFATIVSSTATEGIYTKEIIVEEIDSHTKEITSRVSWDTDPLRDQKVELVALITDTQGFEDTGGDTGGTGLTGDWTNPRTLGSVDLGPGNEATDLDVLNKIVYLSATAAAAAKPDFFIVDATNGEAPVVVSSLDTGVGLNAIDTTTDYAYVANNQITSQLQIINTQNRNNPSITSSFTLPGVSGPNAIGHAIYFYDDRIYISTKRATGPEFHVIDVSDPSNPTSLGSYEVNADVNSIFVKDDKAYLATSDDSKEALILNISNPGSITQVGSFNASGADDGKSIYLSGTKLYLGRSGGTSNFVVIDMTNPASPSQLGSSNLSGTSVNGIAFRDYLSFLVTSDSTKEFQVWNISNPQNLFMVSSFNFPQNGTGVDYENNLVYVSVRSNDALRIITSQQ